MYDIKRRSIKKIFGLMIAMIVYCGVVYGFPKEKDIFFLNSMKAIEVIKKEYGCEDCSEKREILQKLDAIDYLCWEKNGSDYIILIPGSLKKALVDNRYLGDQLEKEYKLQYYEEGFKEITQINNYLITRNEMSIIFLKLLLENDYKFFDWAKKSCNFYDNDDKMTEFYIINFPQVCNMKIYNCHKTISGYRSLFEPHYTLNGEEFSDCISKWKEILYFLVKFKHNPRMNDGIPIIIIRIAGFIGGKDIYDIASSLSAPRIYFGDKNDKRFMEIYANNFKIDLDGIKVPNISLEFDLSDKNKESIKKIQLEEVWIWSESNEKDGNNSIKKIISYKSLFSDILDYYNTIKDYEKFEKFKKNTVNLFYIRTGDFDRNESCLTSRMKGDELPEIKKLIEKVVNKRDRKTKIRLIGYADEVGLNELGYKKWDEVNRTKADERASAVKNWLDQNIGTMNGKIEYLKPTICEKEYFHKKDRCIEIKIY